MFSHLEPACLAHSIKLHSTLATDKIHPRAVRAQATAALWSALTYPTGE